MEIKKPFESNSLKVNNSETEQVFRETCSWYESKFSISDQTSSKAYQKYVIDYHKAKSLYLITNNELIVYDTENEREEVNLLKTPISLDSATFITLLPNGELFFFYSVLSKTESLIINNNYEARSLPFSLPYVHSAIIYFNLNIYYFGGYDKFLHSTAFSKKFDLNKNQWFNLAPVPKTLLYYCHSVIFNENILLSGYNEKILLYSIEIDSFSVIPYEFEPIRKKILINAERLYLIECSGFIYESENEYDWNKISQSSIQNNNPTQIYWVEIKAKSIFWQNLQERDILSLI